MDEKWADGRVDATVLANRSQKEHRLKGNISRVKVEYQCPDGIQYFISLHYALTSSRTDYRCNQSLG